MRIPTLLQKISAIADHPDQRTIIDLDLMLDYTRVLYADLLEWKARLQPVNFRPVTGAHEPTLDELTQSMYEREGMMEDEDTKQVELLRSPILRETETDNSLKAPVTLSTAMEVPAVYAEPQQAVSSTVTPPVAITPQEPVASVSAPTQRMDDKPVAKPDLAPQTYGFQAPGSNDVRSLISINDKYQFMSELFGNDKAAYEAALDTINLLPDAEAAVKWLQDRLWVTEEQRDTAQSFYDIIRRFKTPAPGF